MVLMLARLLLLVLFALLLPSGAMAQDAPPEEIAGEWDLRIDGATIFRFAIEPAGDGAWQGRWSRPQVFNSDGNAFYNIRAGVRTTASMTGLAVGDAVELAFEDPRPGAIPDIFRFRLTGPDSVEMVYVGTGLAPYVLVRAAQGERLGAWDAARTYRRVLPGVIEVAPVPPALPAAAPARAAPSAPAPPVRRLTVPLLDFDLGRGTASPAPPVPVPAPPPEPEPETGTVAGIVAQPVAEPEPDPRPDPEPDRPRIGADFLDGL
jgi:hypothetical protein